MHNGLLLRYTVAIVKDPLHHSTTSRYGTLPPELHGDATRNGWSVASAKLECDHALYGNGLPRIVVCTLHAGACYWRG